MDYEKLWLILKEDSFLPKLARISICPFPSVKSTWVVVSQLGCPEQVAVMEEDCQHGSLSWFPNTVLAPASGSWMLEFCILFEISYLKYCQVLGLRSGWAAWTSLGGCQQCQQSSKWQHFGSSILRSGGINGSNGLEEDLGVVVGWLVIGTVKSIFRIEGGLFHFYLTSILLFLIPPFPPISLRTHTFSIPAGGLNYIYLPNSMMNYLDYFVEDRPEFSECRVFMETFQVLHGELGIPLAKEKMERPSTLLFF